MLTSNSTRPRSRMPDGLDGPASAGTITAAAAKVYRTRVLGLSEPGTGDLDCEGCHGRGCSVCRPLPYPNGEVRGERAIDWSAS